MNEGDAKCSVFYSGTVKEKRQRPRLEWEDNISMTTLELGVRCVVW